MFLYFRRFESSKTVVVPFFCEMQVENAAQFAPAVSTHQATEPAPPDCWIGNSATSRMAWRWREPSNSRARIDTQPAQTMIITAQKGEVDGDWRRDTIEMVALLPDGTARRFPPQTVPVWIRNPFYEGLSTEDMFARMQKSAPWKPGFERMKALMDQGFSMMEALAAVREDPALRRELEQGMDSLSRRPEPK